MKPFFNLYSKGVSPIFGVLLILLVLVLLLLYVRTEISFITSVVFDPQNREDISKDIEFLGIENGELYLGVNKNREELNLNLVLVDGTQCFGSFGNQELNFGINQIDLLNECSLSQAQNYSQIIYQINGYQLQEKKQSYYFDCSSLPGNWTSVPGNAYFSTPNFCVMQFEAKDVAGVATSQPSGTPWGSINFTDARAECTQLNTEHSSFVGTFRMITNREWMTIARNAELQSANWDSGTVGSGSMWRGHSDGSPYSELAVSNTGDYYDGTNNSVPSIERRVLELSNGETIWDLSGNVWEWTDLLENGSSFNENSCSGGGTWYSYFGNDSGSECSFNAPFSKDSAADTRYEMGPLGDYNADNGVGRIRAIGSTDMVLARSGSRSDGVNAGVFNANLNADPLGMFANVGFRCSYTP